MAKNDPLLAENEDLASFIAMLITGLRPDLSEKDVYNIILNVLSEEDQSISIEELVSMIQATTIKPRSSTRH